MKSSNLAQILKKVQIEGIDFQFRNTVPFANRDVRRCTFTPDDHL